MPSPACRVGRFPPQHARCSSTKNGLRGKKKSTAILRTHRCPQGTIGITWPGSEHRLVVRWCRVSGRQRTSRNWCKTSSSARLAGAESPHQCEYPPINPPSSTPMAPRSSGPHGQAGVPRPRQGSPPELQYAPCTRLGRRAESWRLTSPGGLPARRSQCGRLAQSRVSKASIPRLSNGKTATTATQRPVRCVELLLLEELGRA